jgi:hypothetical protein
MPEPDKNIIRIEPGTLLILTIAFLLIPLLVAGFVSH